MLFADWNTSQALSTRMPLRILALLNRNFSNFDFLRGMFVKVVMWSRSSLRRGSMLCVLATCSLTFAIHASCFFSPFNSLATYWLPPYFSASVIHFK
uniref:Cell growth-regulating nucleolar protein n=1 Tax=Cherax quadricarinatus TaxID=27406 RepID=G0ZJD8_CHEQU|nr:cell growth-regulating nucleolar protein [Cherax quadricarinatus]